MALYSINSLPSIDIQSLEFLFLHIEEFRRFENVDINLNGKYKFEFTHGVQLDELTVMHNKNYIDIYDKYKVNLKVLCGVNGSGKTTIIDLLSGKARSKKNNYVIVYIDKNRNFYSTEKIIIQHNGKTHRLDTLDHSLDGLTSMYSGKDYSFIESNLNIHRSIGFSYFKHPDLYNMPHDGVLFSHFIVDCTELNHYDSKKMKEDFVKERIDDDHNFFSLQKLYQENPLLAVFLEFSQDSTFEDFLTKSEYKNLYNSILNHKDYAKLNKRILSLLYGPMLKDSKKEESDSSSKNLIGHVLKKQAQEPKSQEYEFKKYEEISRLIDALSTEADKFYNSVLTFNDRLHFRSNHFIDLFYISSLKKMPDGSSRFLSNLSEGEFINIRNKYYLLPCMLQKDRIWFSEDEPDISLHPEWKRQFIYNYLNDINKTRVFIRKNQNDPVYKDKVYNVILSTHSPFLLSDLTNDQIIFLKINKDEKTEVVDNLKNTFAGNIGEMFHDNFFMDNTIGEFAKKTIEDIVVKLDKPITLKEKDKFEKIINCIGDELLKRLLLDKLHQTKVAS